MKVVASFISNTLFNFVIGLLLARFLGPEDYGLFALAVAVAVLIQTLVFDWARLAAARFYSERVRRDDPTLRATLDASLALLVLALTLVAGGLLVSGITLPMSRALAALAVGIAIANGLFDYNTALVRARFLDGLYARLIIGKNVLSMALTVGGAYWFGSARVALLGVILSMAGAWLSVRRGLTDPGAGLSLADRKLAGTLFRYGLPVVLANMFYQTIPLVDRLVIARLYGLGESGQFSFAYDIGVRIVAAVGTMLDVLLFQIAVRADEIHGSAQGKRQIGDNIGIVIAVLLPACVGVWHILPSFEHLAVPAEFQGHFASTLALLLPGLFCYGLIFFALHPLFQINKTTGPLVAVAAGASLVNLLALALLPHGADTASFAIAQGLALLFGAVALTLWAVVLRPFWPRLRDVVGALFGTGVMIVGLRFFSELRPGLMLLTLQVAAGAMLYGSVAFGIDLCGVRGLILKSPRPWRRGPSST